MPETENLLNRGIPACTLKDGYVSQPAYTDKLRIKF